MHDSKKIKIITHLLRRTNSLPIIQNSPRHNVSPIDDKDIDLITTISLPTTVPEEPKTCCTQPRAMMIAAVITASAVTTASILTAIVTLVVHFAT